MHARRRVVITGIGMVTPLGPSYEATTVAISSGASAIGRTTAFDASGLSGDVAGEVRDFDPRPHFRQPKALKLTSRATQFAVSAAAMALTSGRWPADDGARARLGVILASTSSELLERDLARALETDTLRSVGDLHYFADAMLSRLNPLWLLINLPNMPSAHTAMQLGAHGPNNTVMTDWVGGLQAIGEGADWIRAGEADAVLAGGADTSISPFAAVAHDQAGLLHPATNERHRFVPGEGAAVMLLEDRAHAQARGARILAEVTGYASTTGRTDATSDALVRTMTAVLAEAGWAAADVGTIGLASVAGSGLRDQEDAALHRVLGDAHASMLRAEFQSRLGHALAAVGPIDLGLLLATASSAAPLLSNAVGYGGQVVTLGVMPGPDAARLAR